MSQPNASRQDIDSLAKHESSEDDDSVTEAVETERDSESDASGEFDDGTACDPDFMFADANLDLQTDEFHFWIHTFILEDFQGLESKIADARMDTEEQWRLLVLKDSAEDVRNTLTILYTKPYEPHDFDAATLESALKLATKYDNQELRDYAIQQLSQRPLDPIERFRLARDYDISDWKFKAIEDLCARDDPITRKEASILGSDVFADIAVKREEKQFSRGYRAGASVQQKV